MKFVYYKTYLQWPKLAKPVYLTDFTSVYSKKNNGENYVLVSFGPCQPHYFKQKMFQAGDDSIFMRRCLACRRKYVNV